MKDFLTRYLDEMEAKEPIRNGSQTEMEDDGQVEQTSTQIIPETAQKEQSSEKPLNSPQEVPPKSQPLGKEASKVI